MLGLEWAVDPNGDGALLDHVDVINLSLGSYYGSPHDMSSRAVENAAAIGGTAHPLVSPEAAQAAALAATSRRRSGVNVPIA